MINLKNLIRIGTVSSINYQEGKLRVCFEDQDNIITDELPMLSFEYEMPKIGEPVLCLFLGSGITKGFVLGRYFYDSDPPVEYGQGIYFKRLLEDKDATIKYDQSTKTYILTAGNIIFNGDVQINGTLSVTGDTTIGGNISIGGDATIGGIPFKGHTHIDSRGGTTSPPQ